MYTEEEFYSTELNLSDQEKIDYVRNFLQMKERAVCGQVTFVSNHTAFVAPYDIYGAKVQIFKNPRYRWGIASYKVKGIAELDYVQGELTLHNGRLTLVNIKRMNSYSEFMNSLTEILKKKWKEEEFTFNPKDFAKFDGEVAFASWVTDQVEAMLEEKYENFINEKIAEKQVQKDSLEKEISENKTKIDELQAVLQREKKALVELKENIKDEDRKYEYYKELGIISESKVQKDGRKVYKYKSYEELIDQVWGYLWKKKELFYEKTIIRSFMNALRTQQLVLLWGRPGSGKTSLPMQVAKALGAKCVRIQVQSNWTDNQDLLGFYNIVDKRYVSTRFLDTLLEAGEHPEQLYIILLDEMNLSNIEYYFSEMLNVFTWDIHEDYELYLYSEKLRARVYDEFESVKQNQKDAEEFVAQLSDMSVYRPTIKIPKNIRFVGTLNSDLTTKTISPKVIDRSCFIELQTMGEEVREREIQVLPDKLHLNEEKVYVKAERFRVVVSNEGRHEALVSAVNEFNKYGIKVSNRTNMYIRQWKGWDDTEIDLEEVVLTKIFPMMDYDYDEPHTKKMISYLKRALDGNEKVLEKLDRMEKHAKKIGRLWYWED